MDRFEEERVGLKYSNDLLHEDVLLCVLTRLRLDTQQLVLHLSGLIYENAGGHVCVTRATALGVQLTKAPRVCLTRGLVDE